MLKVYPLRSRKLSQLLYVSPLAKYRGSRLSKKRKKDQKRKIKKINERELIIET
jgi:hypothetical protein